MRSGKYLLAMTPFRWFQANRFLQNAALSPEILDQVGNDSAVITPLLR